MDPEHRRLLARAVRAEEDAQQLRERLAACYEEVAAVRALVPGKARQVAFTPPAPVVAKEDPLVRLFGAIARRPRSSSLSTMTPTSPRCSR